MGVLDSPVKTLANSRLSVKLNQDSLKRTGIILIVRGSPPSPMGVPPPPPRENSVRRLRSARFKELLLVFTVLQKN